MLYVLWILVALLIVIGLAGTVLPALPGAALVFGGILLGAWIDGFQRVGITVVVACGLLMLLSWAADYASALLGAKRAGASREAIIGAALGTVLGLFTGLIGLLFMPLLGAAAGQYLAQRDASRAAQVGLSTWVGLLIGTVAKVVISFVMVGLFLLPVRGCTKVAQWTIWKASHVAVLSVDMLADVYLDSMLISDSHIGASSRTTAPPVVAFPSQCMCASSLRVVCAFPLLSGVSLNFINTDRMAEAMFDRYLAGVLSFPC